jgi:hypothetical protein
MFVFECLVPVALPSSIIEPLAKRGANIDAKATAKPLATRGAPCTVKGFLSEPGQCHVVGPQCICFRPNFISFVQPNDMQNFMLIHVDYAHVRARVYGIAQLHHNWNH